MKTQVWSLVAGVILVAGVAEAQSSGEPAGSPRYVRGAANETVREAQRVLQEAGYYNGPIDGLLDVLTRRAIWDYQRAKGRVPSGSLDGQTVADLGIGAGSAAMQGVQAP